MNESSDVVSRFYARLVTELQEYTAGRKHDVVRGAETAELSAVQLEKYGLGLARALSLLADEVGAPAPDLVGAVDVAVVAIDPEASAHRERRWAARPAGISHGSDH